MKSILLIFLLFASEFSLAQSKSDLVNCLYEFGGGCNGTSMSCFGEAIYFFEDDTYLFEYHRPGGRILLEKGQYKVEDGTINLFADNYIEVWRYSNNNDLESNVFRSFEKESLLNAKHRISTFQFTNCGNKLALKWTVIDGKPMEMNGFFLQKVFEGDYYDSQTKERLSIEEDNYNDTPNIRVTYYNPVFGKDIWLTVIQTDSYKRTLTVQFPGEDKSYILNWPGNEKAMQCLNPDGSIQYFERKFVNSK